ncbi:MAG: K(+)-transporting ATPase subunit C [Armatimonas sp.]
MTNQFRPALVSVGLLTLLTGVLFPGIITGIAAVAFPHQAHGSLITKDGKVVGSALIGQAFTKPQYFQTRPSAAGSGYDGASSSGTNLGPTSAKQKKSISDLADAYRKANGLAKDAPVPADAVTSSASGLDPHISPENAKLQATRVAKARNKSVDDIQKLIESNTEGRSLGFLGDPGVNVLKLNLALDTLK